MLSKFRISEDKTIDKTWNAISDTPGIYIVEWAEHFFILTVEENACYIFDTLGQRLDEDCRKAYLLKFDDATRVWEKPKGKKMADVQYTLLRNGRECCKDYLATFLT